MGSFEFADLYASIADVVAMILQQEMPFGGFAEFVPYLVFADGYKIFKFL